MRRIALAVHGGAGTINRESMSPEKEQLYKETLREAVLKGYNVLERGGTAVDAVELAVLILEDNDLFNAGKGSVFNSEGKHEMDASLMEGKHLKAGAVSGIKNVKNPVKLARLVMENSPHVLLYGQGAEELARKSGLEFRPDHYFYSELRFQQWKEAQKNDSIPMDHNDKKFGTVGAVAVDKAGNLASATSTGGMTNKKYGRIGDSPIIGAGTYANNKTCAISCTGHGEYFLRSVVAYDVSALMEYKGLTLKEASHLVIKDKLLNLGGEGGLIGVDKEGNLSLVYNSSGMYRGWKKEGEGLDAAIW